MLFFDWCRRLAFRDAIQKFCPFPVSFFFFLVAEGRVSLLLKKYCTCLSIHAVEILCHTGGWRSVLLQILGCKIATCEKVRIAGRYCGERQKAGPGCARQLLSNFWRFEFLYFWAIFAHNIALEHIFSTESQRFIQISQIFINLLNT